MDYAYRMYRNVRHYYEQINPATLSGAIDVIVVEQPDGQLLSTPFHVRFGKYGVFNHQEKYVDVSVNGKEKATLKMKLGENGIAFFVQATDDAVPDYLVTSPVPGDELIPTQKVLEESARHLEMHQRERDLGENGTLTTSISRRAKSCVRGERSIGKEISERSVEAERKKTLPFTCSVFSDRVYRSLPDVSTLVSEFGETSNVDVAEETLVDPFKTPQRRIPRLRHSKSQALEKEDDNKQQRRSNENKPRMGGKELEPIHSPPKSEDHEAISGHDDESTPEAAQPLDSPRETPERSWPPHPTFTPSQPISIHTPQIAEDVLSTASSSPSSQESTPSLSHLDPAAEARLASGALSDTEVDRHKNIPAPHGSDVAYWNWGQFPKTREEQQMEEKAAIQKEGIYLDDLASFNDATQIEKYLGRKGGGNSRSIDDSGAGSSGLNTQPNSPLAASPDTTHLVIDDKTPTRPEAPCINEAEKEKEEFQQKESISIRCTSSGSDNIFQMSEDEEEIEDETSLDSDPASGVENAAVAVKKQRSKRQNEKARVNGQKKEKDHKKREKREKEEPGTNEEKAEEVKKEETAEKQSEEVESTRKEEVGEKQTGEEKEKPTEKGEKMEDGEEVKDEAVKKEDGLEITRFFRSLRLSSDRLRSLELRMGANECRFSITTKFQGTTWCSCNIYLYHHTEKIVISDIDGTITKSDVLGHVIPAIGGQWAHTGVAELYTRIKSNGYKLVYLSSRAIGQAAITKNYLKSVQQDAKVLPDGPVLLAPDSVLVAFRREVIERKPEQFKIAALSDLKKLFPNVDPFFAGFGNRDTDVKSYRAVDIDLSRILIIDPSGKLKRADSPEYTTSYECMAQDSVDCIFPPLLEGRSRHRTLMRNDDARTTFSRPQTHSAFTHWRHHDPTANLSDSDMAAYETKRKPLKKK